MYLQRDEMETHVSQTAQERIEGIVVVYSDDPVWMRKLDKLADDAAERNETVEIVRTEHGAQYTFRNDCVTLSLRLKRQISDKEREAMRLRAKENLNR